MTRPSLPVALSAAFCALSIDSPIPIDAGDSPLILGAALSEIAHDSFKHFWILGSVSIRLKGAKTQNYLVRSGSPFQSFGFPIASLAEIVFLVAATTVC